MGTILHEGEYILISRKIIKETQYTGYAILFHIGINTSKVKYIDSTKNFLTYVVMEDLELPFDTSKWQDFKINSVRFHTYTHSFKNLIIIEHDGDFDYFDKIDEFFEEKEKENRMVLKKGNYIYIATAIWAWSDDTLITAIMGFLPPGRETMEIVGEEGSILWSKTKISNDIYYSAIDASVRLHKLDNDLDFTVTNYGDIIIYRTSKGGYTPQEVLDSYNRYISSSFFIREENKEDNKMTIEANRYIYIATNTTGLSDDQLISTLLGYVPMCTKYELIHHECTLLWSRIKFLHERSFVFNDAERRLHERDKKLDFIMSAKGDIIIYRDINGDKQRIIKEYDRISREDKPKIFNPEDLNRDSIFSLHCKPFITMSRNLGRSQAISMLNSFYGLNPTGGFLNWNAWDISFKLYFGVERATGKQKTVCLWKDGEKTVIRGDKSVLSMPVQYAVAWCYVKRRFKTTSQFKKYVDNRSHILDGITYFEGDARVKGAQASVNNRTKKYDIYDTAALAITAKHYGSVKTIMNYCDGWGE